MHDAGLVHSDVKAQNVLRDGRGRLVLGDFGTGRELDAAGEGGQGLAGTPTYLAPEICSVSRPRPPATSTAWACCSSISATAQYPVQGRTLAELQSAHATGRHTRLDALRPDLPAWLTAVVDSALDPDPRRRFASARDMAAALAPPAWRGPRLRQAAVSVVALVTTVGLLAGLSRPTFPAVPVPPGSAVLVADIQNDTGEPLLDGTVRFALERELAAVAPVAARGRIDDALALMRRPSGARLDTELAREVALRDGAIAAVIGGRVERLGTRYTGDRRGAPARRRNAGRFAARAKPAAASMLHGIRRLSAGVRRHLGDACGRGRILARRRCRG